MKNVKTLLIFLHLFAGVVIICRVVDQSNELGYFLMNGILIPPLVMLPIIVSVFIFETLFSFNNRKQYIIQSFHDCLPWFCGYLAVFLFYKYLEKKIPFDFGEHNMFGWWPILFMFSILAFLGLSQKCQEHFPEKYRKGEDVLE